MRLRLWPRSLAWRTGLIVLGGLVVVQAAGLTIHALDRLDLQRVGQARFLAERLIGTYRNVVNLPPDQRAAWLTRLPLPPEISAVIADQPPQALPFSDRLDGGAGQVARGADLTRMPPVFQRMLRISLALTPLPPGLRPHRVRLLMQYHPRLMVTAMEMPDRQWLVIRNPMPPPPHMWGDPSFLVAFALMTVVAAALTLWAAQRLVAPVRVLAAAAERLGRDVTAAPLLPEDGPLEVATAAMAFNTMATRIRRFVQDRTFLLTAIGHDLRTPITRLKLRAEFIEDDELRDKFLDDLVELEAMVSATLAFGRDVSGTEAAHPLDLPALLRTVLDDAADAAPDLAGAMTYEGPAHLTINGRPMALKRALANLVANALAYGQGAHITLSGPEMGPPVAGALGRGAHGAARGMVRIAIADDGPGIPPEALELVFEPFRRLESSRNRETGGTGLGLPIARNILRAHGGDITLANRPGGGAVAMVTLPV